MSMTWKDQAIGRGLRDACELMRDSIVLLAGDPMEVVKARRAARVLCQGPIGEIVFKVSQVPDFREIDHVSGIDPQNLARYELYLKRLSAVGADPVEMQRRQAMGLSAKFRIHKGLPSPRSRAADQSGVHPRFKVV